MENKVYVEYGTAKLKDILKDILIKHSKRRKMI